MGEPLQQKLFSEIGKGGAKIDCDFVLRTLQENEVAWLWKEINGLTPLHLGCQYGSLELIKLLVKKYPESTQVRNGRGHLPVLFTARGRWLGRRNDAVIEWFEERERELPKVEAAYSYVRSLDGTAYKNMKKIFDQV